MRVVSTNRVGRGKSLRSVNSRLISVLMKVVGIVLLWSLLWLPCVGQDSDDHALFITPGPPTIKLAIGQPNDIAAGDFNEDGSIDLVVTATQGFAAATSGASEVTWTTNLVLLFGDGKGDFGAPIYLLSESGEHFLSFRDIYVKDMNADSHLDIVFTGVKGLKNPQGEVLLLLGDGTEHFSEPQRLGVGVTPVSPVSADFNDDGRMDIAVADPYSPAVYVLLQNNGDTLGRRSAQIAFQQERQYPGRLAVGDFNEDGHIDLGVAGFKYIGLKRFVRFIVILLGDGTGKFSEKTRIDFEPFENNPVTMSLIAVDYDHDGHLDLITSKVDEAILLQGNGKGEFKQETLFPLESSATDLSLCELNDDDCWDWVIVAPFNHKADVIVSRCGTAKYGQDELISDPTPVAAAVIDVNNDSKNDVVLMRNMQTDTEAGGKHVEWTYIDILLNSL